MKSVLMWLIPYLGCLFFNVNAQGLIDGKNLVQNGSFEEIDSCPGNLNGIFYINNWKPLTSALTAYFNSCAPTYNDDYIISYNVPYINNLTFQNAHTGNAFIMIGNRFFNNIPYNASYIETSLTEPLIHDVEYCVELYANIPDFVVHTFIPMNVGFYYKFLTAFFSSSTLDTTLYYVEDNYLNFEPSVKLYSKDNMTMSGDTVKWTKLYGQYKSKKNVKYLTIGIFGLNIEQVHIPSLNISNNIVSNLFIDDVAVYKGKCREEEKPQKTFFNLYPNPGSGLFSLNYGVAQDAQLLVYDILGRTVLTETLAADKVLHHFNLAQMSNGIYFLKVISMDDENLYSQKFLLQR